MHLKFTLPWAGLATAAAALERTDKRRLAAATAAFERRYGLGLRGEAVSAHLSELHGREPACLTCTCSLCRAFANQRPLPPLPPHHSGGEEESQQLFDARAALVRLHALLSLAPGGAAAEDEEVYDGLNRLLEVRLCA